MTAKILGQHSRSVKHNKALSKAAADRLNPSSPLANHAFHDQVEQVTANEEDLEGRDDSLHFPLTSNISEPVILESIDTISQWLARLQLHGNDPLDFAHLFPAIEEKAPRRKKVINNAVYFEAQHHTNGGPMAIVGSSLHGSSDMTTALSSINPGHCLFEMMLAMFAANLTQSENDILGALLQYVRHCPENLGSLLLDGTVDLPLMVPNHGKDIRSKYVEGPFSIMETIPRPSIQVLPDGHIYISIRESIQHLLAHGIAMDPLLPLNRKVSSSGPLCHGSSPRGQQLMESVDVEYIFPLKCIFWSDGFITSNVVQTADSSVHTAMLSIGTPEGDHSGGNTCLVWLGPSSADHETVESLLCEELQKLTSLDDPKNIFYHGGIKKNVRLYLAIYAGIGDRPDRTSRMRLAAGNSMFTARWGWSANLYLVQDILPPCEFCLSNLLKDLPVPDYCTHSGCAAFDFSRLTYPTSKDYPAEFRPFFGDRMPCKPITFDAMKQAMSLAYQKVLIGGWRKPQVSAYLRPEGLQPNLIDTVFQNANRERSLQTTNNVTLRARLQIQKENYPFMFRPVMPPPFWNLDHLDVPDFIDAVMHQIFLGTERGLSKDLVCPYLKSHKKLSSFTSHVNGPLASVKNLGLAQWKAEPIGGKATFGGYISKNWECYCRLSKWLHGVLPVLAPTDVAYSDPDKEYADYTSDEMKAFLESRKIAFDGRWSARRIRELFDTIVSSPSGPPPMVEVLTSDAPVSLVEDTIISHLATVSRIMAIESTPTEEEILQTDRHIKIFLKYVDNYDLTIRCHGRTRIEKEAFIIRKYNYISMLNLPSTLRRYGSLRLLYEGGGMGEKSIQLLKKHINGTNGNFAYNTALRYLKDKSIKWVVKDIAEGLMSQGDAEELQEPVKNLLRVAKKKLGLETDVDEEDKGDDAIYYPPDESAIESTAQQYVRTTINSRYKDVHVYSNMAEGISELASGRPVSIVMLVDNSFWILLKNDTAMQVHHVGTRTDSRCGADYFRWGPADVQRSTQSENLRFQVKEYCLLLPKLIKKGLPPATDDVDLGREYYLITTSWKEMLLDTDGSAMLVLPRVRDGDYDE